MSDQTENVENQEPLSLRETIAANLEAAEAGTLGQEPEEETGTRVRDEHGRFTKVADTPVATAPAPEAQPVVPVQEQPTKAELTTWRKEFKPLQEKLAIGQPLTPEEAKKLAEYNVQREREYSTGISTYKSEAQQAKQFTDALQEFMPILQQHSIEPAQWIQNLGRAHQTLAMGSPEQKIQMFQRLAQDYGIPLGAVQQAQAGQLDPTVMALMQEIQHLKAGFTDVKSWREQQEQEVVNQQLAKFSDASKYPHFEQVRGVMAQLLESGMATDPDKAYEKAIRLDESIWDAEQQRQAAAQQAQSVTNKAAAAAKARQAGGQVRTGSPAGSSTGADPRNLRGTIEAAFDTVSGGGRV
jgi:tetratricopeptide (TPR) repeat protein